jgi:hypothetical protein
MRVKHLMILILTSTFGISTAFSTVCIPPILLTGHENPGPYLIPRGAISAVCVAIFLIPHHWLALLALPRRLYLYVRLSSLENQLLELVVLRRKRLRWRHMLCLDKVDMAIYIITINILDHYRRADLRDPLGCELYAKIQVLLAQEVGYDEFVEALCHVTL